MFAWLCENPTGVDALTWTELPTPTPGPGEVLLAIEAASLNFPATDAAAFTMTYATMGSRGVQGKLVLVN